MCTQMPWPGNLPGRDRSLHKQIDHHGKTITGFNTKGEDIMGIMDIIRGWGEPLIDGWAERLSAKCAVSWMLETNFEDC